MDPLITLKNVNIIFNEGEGSREVGALTDINIEIFPQEYVIFFGPSGCGKSTLMNVIAGLQEISSGSTLVGGHDVTKLTDEEMATYHRHQVGFIFQAYNLIPTLSVLENIALPQMFDGLSKRQWTDNARALAERFDILEQVDKIPSELSGGQQQRVGVARSLVNNPSILLADEPTGNLDSKNVGVVLDIFQDLNLKEKKTILLVTHSPDYLGEADRVFYLKDGKIVDEARNKKRNLKRGDDLTKAEELKRKTHTLSWQNQLEDIYIPTSVKSEKLTDYVFHGDGRKRERVKLFVEKRIQNIIQPEELVKFMDMSYYTKGAGLNRRTARMVAEKVENTLLNAQAITLMQEVEGDEALKMLTTLRENIEATLKLKLDEEEQKLLEEIIKSRIGNAIDPIQVREVADKAKSKGGLELRRQTANKLMYYLELIVLIAGKPHRKSTST